MLPSPFIGYVVKRQKTDETEVVPAFPSSAIHRSPVREPREMEGFSDLTYRIPSTEPDDTEVVPPFEPKQSIVARCVSRGRSTRRRPHDPLAQAR